MKKAKKDYSDLPKKSKKEPKLDIEKRICRLVRLMLLLDKGVLNLDHAAKDCGVNKRTIQRDLKVLEAAGIPLYKPLKSNSNYQLDKDFRFFRYHITPENLQNFLDTTLTMMKFSKHPLDLVNPIQQEVLEVAKNEEEQRKTILKTVNYLDVQTTPAQFNSLCLQGTTNTSNPLARLHYFFLADHMFNAIENDRSFGYRKLQLDELQRTLAHSARITRNYKKALKYLKDMLKKDPTDDWAYVEMAFVYYEMGDICAAIQTLQSGRHSIQEEHLNVYLAFFLMESKQYNAALRLCKKFSAEPHRALFLSSEVHKREGKLELALQEINEALALCQESGCQEEAYYQIQRGVLLEKLNQATKK